MVNVAWGLGASFRSTMVESLWSPVASSPGPSPAWGRSCSSIRTSCTFSVTLRVVQPYHQVWEGLFLSCKVLFLSLHLLQQSLHTILQGPNLDTMVHQQSSSSAYTLKQTRTTLTCFFYIKVLLQHKANQLMPTFNDWWKYTVGLVLIA